MSAIFGVRANFFKDLFGLSQAQTNISKDKDKEKKYQPPPKLGIFFLPKLFPENVLSDWTLGSDLQLQVSYIRVKGTVL